IDLCDDIDKPQVVIQAKHYSKYSDLKSVLKKELEKVKALKPHRYILCTSLELTLTQRKEILGLFVGFMKDGSDIVDGTEINAFLEKEENIDILNKNFKVWLCSSSMLEILKNRAVFFDSDDLIMTIKKQLPLFVSTKCFFKAREVLDKLGIIIITGAPGVGKSTVSRMLLLEYANKQYSVRYTTDNKIDRLKEALSADRDKKEIILLDDFLGQNYLNLRETLPNEIKTLVSYVARNRNKKLILNTRITILNEAEQKSQPFSELIDEYSENRYLIDLNKMPKLERAQILYNHIYFKGLPEEYFAQVVKNRNYIRIVEHKNYNPRIIEFVTNKRQYESTPAENYFQFVMDKLNNPSDVWHDEFRNRMDVSDRIFMNTLYSLTNTSVKTDILKKAFERRLKDESIDTSGDVFNETFKRLTSSLIKTTGKIVGVINPSVNDYLKSQLRNNTPEQLKIIKNAVFYEQAVKMAVSEDAKSEFNRRFVNGELLSLKTIEKDIYYYHFEAIVTSNVKDNRFKEIFVKAVENLKFNIYYTPYISQLIKNFFCGGFIQFYQLESTVFTKSFIESSIKLLNYQDLTTVCNEPLAEYFRQGGDASVFEIVQETILAQMEEEIEETASQALAEHIQDLVEDEVPYDADYNDYDTSDLVDDAEDYIEDCIEDLIKEEIASFDEVYELYENDISEWDIRFNLDIDREVDSAVESYLNNRGNDFYDDSDDDEDEDEEVDRMFGN
ncbi:MAG: hypothetical protein J1E95_11125, partial [Muribaculaceae bacterium]|nr:hypothetical protein [Muribaculaceae bacterium]